MDDDRPRVRLGSLVRSRRLALGMTQAEAAASARISDSTWLAVEKGGKVSERSLVGVDRALGWEQGSCDRILRGEEPMEAARAAVRPPGFSLADEVAALRQELAEIRERLDAEKR